MSRLRSSRRFKTRSPQKEATYLLIDRRNMAGRLGQALRRPAFIIYPKFELHPDPTLRAERFSLKILQANPFFWVFGGSGIAS